MIKRLVKQLLPRTVRRALQRTRQDLQIRSALKPLRRTGSLTHDEMLRFRGAWGNEAWSGDVRFLEETITAIKSFGGPVLECGSGATSILAGVLAARSNLDVYCLEQEPAWAERIRYTAKRERLTRLHVIDAPLIRYPDSGYVWYDVSGIHLPRRFGTVICDGPAVLENWGDPYHKSWRRGLMPFLNDREFGAVLLDDFEDERASALLDYWVSQFNVTVERISDSAGACGVIHKPERSPNPSEHAM